MLFTEKNIVDKDIHSLLLGAFIRYERKKQNLSLNFLANEVGITKSYLGDIEHGKKVPAKYTLQKIMSTLDIEFNDSILYRQKIIQKLIESFEAYAYANREEIINIYNTLIQEKSFYSCAFITLYIIQLLHTLYIENDLEKSFSIIDMINQYQYLLDKQELSIYYILIGLYYYKKNDFDVSKSYYLLSLENHFNNNIIIGMTYYLLSLDEQYLNNLIDSYMYCEKSIDYFKNTYNTIRLLELDIFKANCYSRNKKYDKAIFLYEYVLKYAHIHHLSRIEKMAYDNLAWTYLKVKDYHEVIKYTECSIKSDNDYWFKEVYTYIPYALYKLNKIDECLNEINKNLIILENNYHKYFLKALQEKIKNNDNLYVKYLNTYCRYLIQFSSDNEMLKCIYEELLIYYKLKNDYENQIYMQEKIIELINES